MLCSIIFKWCWKKFPISAKPKLSDFEEGQIKPNKRIEFFKYLISTFDINDEKDYDVLILHSTPENWDLYIENEKNALKKYEEEQLKQNLNVTLTETEVTEDESDESD